MLETETDVTQEEHSDSTSTLNSDSEIITKAKQSVDKLFSDNEVDTDLEAAIIHVNAKLIELKNEKQCSRKSSLWFQYMRMMNILKLFIQAERTGDWDLHLVALHEMLPYFAAAGHNLYTKSIHL